MGTRGLDRSVKRFLVPQFDRQLSHLLTDLDKCFEEDATPMNQEARICACFCLVMVGAKVQNYVWGKFVAVADRRDAYGPSIEEAKKAIDGISTAIRVVLDCWCRKFKNHFVRTKLVKSLPSPYPVRS